MTEATDPSESYFLTGNWTADLEAVLLRVPRTQLVPESDLSRLLACTAVQILLSYHLFSDEPIERERALAILLRLSEDLIAAADACDAELPSLTEMTVVSEMTSTAFSIIAYQFEKNAIGDCDVAKVNVSDGLLNFMKHCCDKGDSKTRATVASILRSIVPLYISQS